MDVIHIEAQPRSVGKQAARAARREDMIPCILYGPRVDPVAFQVPLLSLNQLIFTNVQHRVEIRVEDRLWECILKDVTFHPTSDRPLHADFQVLQAGEKLTLTVPVHFQGTPVGVAIEGGEPNFITHELEIRCLPRDIPEAIHVDVSGLHIGDSIHLGDIEVPGVEFIGTSDKALATVLSPRVVVVPVEEEPEAEDAEEGEGQEEEGES
jgi:large subunit ribosomal protein L25